MKSFRKWIERNVITDDPMDDEAIRWQAREAQPAFGVVREPWFSIYGGDILTALRDVSFGADPNEVYAQMKEDFDAQ